MMDQLNVNVLLIEDDESSTQITKELLDRSESTNFSIDSVETLSDAIETLENNNTYDVIILDLVLPNGQGVNVFKSIKKVTNLPIVITSGYEDKAIECVKLGAQDYLVKPHYDGRTLIRSIRYAIERYKTENMYKGVIKSSPIGYHIYRMKGNDLIFVDYNPAADKILNIDHSEFLYEPIDVPFPDLSTELINLYKDVLKTGSTFTDLLTEYEDHKIKKGYFKISGHRTGAGELAITFEDVTKSILTQKKLEESRKKYKQVVEGTKAAIYEIDFETMRFTYMNDVALNETGYTKEEMLDMTPVDILTEDSMNRWLDRLEKIQNGEDIDNIEEFQIRRKDGSLIWALITADYKRDSNDSIIGASVVAIDITEKKTKENLLNTIYRTAPVGLGLLDTGRNIIDVNGRFCEMFGYTKNEMAGMNAVRLYINEEEYVRIGKIKYQKIEETGIGIVECKMKKKNGEVMDILLTSAKVDEYNVNEGYTFSVLDITQTKEFERQIEFELNKRLDLWKSEVGVDFQNLNRLESIMSL